MMEAVLNSIREYLYQIQNEKYNLCILSNIYKKGVINTCNISRTWILMQFFTTSNIHITLAMSKAKMNMLICSLYRQQKSTQLKTCGRFWANVLNCALCHHHQNTN